MVGGDVVDGVGCGLEYGRGHPLPGDGLYSFLEELSGLRSAPTNKKVAARR